MFLFFVRSARRVVVVKAFSNHYDTTGTTRQKTETRGTKPVSLLSLRSARRAVVVKAFFNHYDTTSTT